jgi:hypothetical protein
MLHSRESDYNCKHAMSLSEPKFTTHYTSITRTTYVHAVVQIQSMFRRYKAMRRVAVLRIEKAFIRATYDPTTYCDAMKRCANGSTRIRMKENKKSERQLLIQDAWKLETTLDIHHNLS